MAKYKPNDYSQRVMVPVSLEEQLEPGTWEFSIQTWVEDRNEWQKAKLPIEPKESARSGELNFLHLLEAG